MNRLKLSEIIPVSVLLHSPWTLSTYSGMNLNPEMVIALPFYRSYYQRVCDLVATGEIHQIGSTFYLTFTSQSPRIPKLPSLPVEFDITTEEWQQLHLPTQAGIHTS